MAGAIALAFFIEEIQEYGVSLIYITLPMKNAVLGFLIITAGLWPVSKSFAQNQPPLKDVKDDVAQKLYEGSVLNYKSEEAYSAGPWAPVRDKEILWKKRAWRTIDLTDKANKNLTKAALGSTLGEILINGVMNEAYKAYAGTNDRFATEMTQDELIALLQKTVNGKRMLDPSAITKFRVKEDWLYLVNEQKLVSRIIGIAPVITVVDASGEVSEQDALWVYYPIARSYLKDQKIAGSIGRSYDNLDQLFETHAFKASVDEVKSSPYGGY